MEFNTDKPTRTALYLVDRGPQGKWYRWYNVETDQWGRCGIDMQEAIDNKICTAVGFFPWVGPLTGPKFDSNKPIVVVAEDTKPTKPAKTKPAKVAKVKPAKKMAKMRTVPAVVNKTLAKMHPDGTVFFREDRQKWIAMMNGKQEAARPTADACLKFLAKKYGVTGTVIN